MAKEKEETEKTGEGGAPVPFMGYPGMSGFGEEMERMMRRFFSDDWMARMAPFQAWPRMAAELPFAALMNSPKADMSEGEKEYQLSVELPGLDEQDIELTLTDTALVLKGEKKVEKEGQEKDYHFSERSFGSIRRQFPLPRDVDRDGMKATFSKGVLHVTLPKTEEAKRKPRRISVTST